LSINCDIIIKTKTEPKKEKMLTDTMVIRNHKNEQLDVLISGNESAQTAIVFVHGFGSNKHENFNLFDDIAASLEDNFHIIRFDFSGYGKSEGRQEDSCLDKMKGDLYAVVEYAKLTHQKVFIIAHSMGTFAVSMLHALDVERIVFTSPPNTDTKLLVENMQERIIKAGGSVNEKSITIYPRTSGETQKMGEFFWTDLRQFAPVGRTKVLALYSSLAIFNPEDDEVVKGRSLDHVKEYERRGIHHVYLPGNHNFTKPADRKKLIEEINTFLRKRKMVFIAHPISGDVEANIEKVIEICCEIHSNTIIPVFPSLLWRQYIGDNGHFTPNEKKLLKQVNEELFGRKGIDEVWYYGDTLSSGMKDEVELALKNGIPNIGKTPNAVFELTKYVD
jgi:pimeloyl-ACP methyl ester carboxylesterase